LIWSVVVSVVLGAGHCVEFNVSTALATLLLKPFWMAIALSVCEYPIVTGLVYNGLVDPGVEPSCVNRITAYGFAVIATCCGAVKVEVPTLIIGAKGAAGAESKYLCSR
jgi:hypothetical protein